MKEKNYIEFLVNFFTYFKSAYILAKIDLKVQYNRTFLGRLWKSLAMLITILLLSLIWANIFNLNLLEYLPRLFVGMAVFNLILHFTLNATTAIYSDFSSIIKNTNINLSLLYSKYLIKGLLDFLYSLPIITLLIFFCNIQINYKIIFFILGLFLIFLNAIWISFFISTICARFRDLTPLFHAILSAASLYTPILWEKEMLKSYSNYVYLNPFTSFVESVRDPILNYDINYNIYFYELIFLIFGNLFVYFYYKKTRPKMSHWT